MKAFITIARLKFHFGSKPFEVGQKVKLVKEPDNEYDSEAIKAELSGLGCAG
uniref:HIRAN domain-containing protein n=1 Tax=Gemmiger formicilis TaxID=745368 RepID=UPI003FEEFA54